MPPTSKTGLEGSEGARHAPVISDDNVWFYELFKPTGVKKGSSESSDGRFRVRLRITAKLDFVRKGSQVLIEPGPVSKKFRLDLLDFSFSFLIKFALDSPYRLGPFEKLTGNELE